MPTCSIICPAAHFSDRDIRTCHVFLEVLGRSTERRLLWDTAINPPRFEGFSDQASFIIDPGSLNESIKYRNINRINAILK